MAYIDLGLSPCNKNAPLPPCADNYLSNQNEDPTSQTNQNKAELVESYVKFKNVNGLVFFSIKQGGVDSGFVHVEAKEYKPRLLRFRIEKGKFVMSEVQCKRANLDSGDVFILDNGLDIHQWNGKSASGMEKMKVS